MKFCLILFIFFLLHLNLRASPLSLNWDVIQDRIGATETKLEILKNHVVIGVNSHRESTLVKRTPTDSQLEALKTAFRSEDLILDKSATEKQILSSITNSEPFSEYLHGVTVLVSENQSVPLTIVIKRSHVIVNGSFIFSHRDRMIKRLELYSVITDLFPSSLEVSTKGKHEFTSDFNSVIEMSKQRKGKE